MMMVRKQYEDEEYGSECNIRIKREEGKPVTGEANDDDAEIKESVEDEERSGSERNTRSKREEGKFVT